MSKTLQQVAQQVALLSSSAAPATDVSTLRDLITALTTRVDALEAFQASAATELADHESRITALEP